MILPAREADADAIAAMIRLVLVVSNSDDYPPELLAHVAAGFTADLVRGRIASTYMLVAHVDGRPVGTGSLDRTSMRSLFVDPLFQRRGIGSSLCDAIEGEAMCRGLPAIDVQSSLTARVFYARRSYRLVSETDRDGERIVMMQKSFL